MELNRRDLLKVNQTIRDLFLEASEEELREALAGEKQDYDSLAARGRSVAKRAIEDSDDTFGVQDLHRGLGALIRMLRRRERVSVDELAELAHIDAAELRSIENDPAVDPNPRTIYQLEQYFNLQPRSLVLLSGAVRAENRVRAEALRFAASSENMSSLSEEERKLLNHFVKVLGEHTDR